MVDLGGQKLALFGKRACKWQRRSSLTSSHQRGASVVAVIEWVRLRAAERDREVLTVHMASGASEFVIVWLAWMTGELIVPRRDGCPCCASAGRRNLSARSSLEKGALVL